GSGRTGHRGRPAPPRRRRRARPRGIGRGERPAALPVTQRNLARAHPQLAAGAVRGERRRRQVLGDGVDGRPVLELPVRGVLQTDPRGGGPPGGGGPRGWPSGGPTPVGPPPPPAAQARPPASRTAAKPPRGRPRRRNSAAGRVGTSATAPGK